MAGEDLDGIYTRRYWRSLSPCAAALQRLLESQLQEVPRIDRIAARAKSPDRFLAKAERKTPDGTHKYAAPLDQIQDQIAARVIVLYTSDVPIVAKKIEDYYRHIERRTVVPDDNRAFGYAGVHYILALPGDAVPAEIRLDDAPSFFELQIRTLWQHAWSEANHDLGYKTPTSLSPDQERRHAFAAAQAWGADRIFEELHAEAEAAQHHVGDRVPQLPDAR
jgi:ppGpp synthetase/RelA/SpoT-type nucleotidyltranferase